MTADGIPVDATFASAEFHATCSTTVAAAYLAIDDVVAKLEADLSLSLGAKFSDQSKIDFESTFRDAVNESARKENQSNVLVDTYELWI